MDLESALDCYQTQTKGIEETIQRLLGIDQENRIDQMKQLDQSICGHPSATQIAELAIYLTKMQIQDRNAIHQSLQLHPPTSQFLQITNIITIILCHPSNTKHLKNRNRQLQSHHSIPSTQQEEPHSYSHSQSYSQYTQSQICPPDLQHFSIIQNQSQEQSSISSISLSSIAHRNNKAKEQYVNQILKNTSINVLQRIITALKPQKHPQILLTLLLFLTKEQPQDVEQLCILGQVYLTLKLPKLAKQSFIKLLNKYPHYFEVHFLMGQCARQTKNYQQAIQSYQTAIALSENNLKNKTIYDCHYYIGSLLLQQLKIFEAMEYFKICHKAAKNNYLGPFNYAQCLYHAKMYQQAYNYLIPIQMEYIKDKIVQPLGVAMIHTLLGNIKRQLNKPIQEVIQQYNKAIKQYKYQQTYELQAQGIVNPDLDVQDKDIHTYYVYLQKGRTYFKHGLQQEALVSYQICQRNAPLYFASIHISLAQLHLKKHNLTQLTQCLYMIRNAFHLDQDVFQLEELFEMCLQIKKYRVYQQHQAQMNKILQQNEIRTRYRNQMPIIIEKIILTIYQRLICVKFLLMESCQKLIKQNKYTSALQTFKLLNQYLALEHKYDNHQVQTALNLSSSTTNGSPIFHNLQSEFPPLPDLYFKHMETLVHKLGKKKTQKEVNLYQSCVELFEGRHFADILIKRYLDTKDTNLCRKMMLQSLQNKNPPTQFTFFIMIQLYRRGMITSQDILFDIIKNIELCNIFNDSNHVLHLFMKLKLYNKVDAILRQKPPPGVQPVVYCQWALQYFKINKQEISSLEPYQHSLLFIQKLGEVRPTVIVELASVYQEYQEQSKALELCQKEFEKNTQRNKQDSYADKSFNQKNHKKQLLIKIINLYKKLQLHKKPQNILLYTRYCNQMIDLMNYRLNLDPNTPTLQGHSSSQQGSRSAQIKQICGFYKDWNLQNQNYVTVLKLAIQLKPLNLTHLEDLINLCLEIRQDKQQHIQYIHKYIKNSPSKKYPYDKLLSIHYPTLDDIHDLDIRQRQQIAATLRKTYLAATLEDGPFEAIFYYCYFQLYNQTWDEFRQLMKRQQAKKEAPAKRKESYLKMITNLKKGKNNFNQKGYFALMRAILSYWNSNAKMRKQSYLDALTGKQLKQISLIQQRNQLTKFLVKITDLSPSNKLFILSSLCYLTQSPQVKQDLFESGQICQKTSMMMSA